MATKTAYYADCDQFDNHRTGYHSAEAEAIEAFWAENEFSERERASVVVYTRKQEIGRDELATARYLAARGVPSPALGIDATA